MINIKQYVAMAVSSLLIASVIPFGSAYADDITKLDNKENINIVEEDKYVSINASDITRSSMKLTWEDSDFANSNYVVRIYSIENIFPVCIPHGKVLNVSSTNSVQLTNLLGGMNYRVEVRKGDKVIASKIFKTLPDFVVFVGESLYKDQKVKDAIDTYIKDIRNQNELGAEVVRISKTDGNVKGVYKCTSPESFKNLIREKYYDGNGAQGFVIIGSGEDIPTAIVESTGVDEKGKKSSEIWPSDLYFADMDGDWKDTDSDGMFEDSEADGQRYTPEMYFGRINSNGLAETTEEQAEYIVKYLDRVHKYKTIGDNLDSNVKGRALSYNDADFAQYIDPIPSYSSIFKNINFIRDPNETCYDNLKKAFNDGYEFINLDIHSYNNKHEIHKSVNGIDKETYYNINKLNKDLASGSPKFNFMNMYCCSGCKFESGDGTALENLGAYYLFRSETGLNIAGSTGAFGPWLDYDFYNKLADNYSVGEAYKEFFGYQKVHANQQSKGVLLGDPTIKYRINKLNNATPYVTTDLSGKINIGKTSKFVSAKAGEEFKIEAADSNNDQVYFDFENTLPEGTLTRQEGSTIYLTFPKCADEKNKTFNITMNVFNKNLLGEKINNYKEVFNVDIK